jgi:hypothetical protein
VCAIDQDVRAQALFYHILYLRPAHMDPHAVIMKANLGTVIRMPTVLALKFVYYLDGEKAALNFMSDDISILACEKAKGNYYYLDS